MSVKYVFVTGGVVSGLGKGITASSLGRLLKARGYKVTMQKFDPYLNVDPGTMNPIQHGEVFVTDDGAETDLDLGHYERFIDECLNKGSSVTSGKIYSAVLNKERKGDYGGGTVQIIPHVTNEIKSRFYKGDPNYKGTEIAIIEVGGTVGDIESQPHIESIRQFKLEQGPNNVILIHVTLIPYLACSQELKTKPTQSSVKTLQGMGIQPDIIVSRSEIPLDPGMKDKISLFCNVPKENVIQNLNCETLYEIPIMMEKEGLAKAACKCLGLKETEPDLADWKKMISNFKNPKSEINVAIVGKYTALHDAYLSVVEAVKAAAAYKQNKVNFVWIDSDDISKDNVKKLLKGVDAIVVPGGFGKRGTEEMQYVIKYARENNIPFLGICLGMQLACIEFAKNVLKLADANSSEFNSLSKNPIIHIMPDQIGIDDIGGTLRLGSYPCVLDKSSKVYKLFGKEKIDERHRHRYEFNNEYREQFIKNGFKLAGKSPDDHIVEMVELENHPFFVGTQSHPELKSRPNRPHPLFLGLVDAAIKCKGQEKNTDKKVAKKVAAKKIQIKKK